MEFHFVITLETIEEKEPHVCTEFAAVNYTGVYTCVCLSASSDF